MRAGKLNSRVTIQELASGQDEAGQPTSTWVDVVTVWASILHKTGSESIKADQDVSLVQSSIRIRRRSGINAGMRVLFGDTVYEIKAVLPDEQDRQRLDLVCQLING